MLRPPTRRIKKRANEALNLVSILDAIFIFIFFLLMSAQFIKIYEISSDVPIISNSPPPKEDKKPLALTLIIENNQLVLASGVPQRTLKRFGKVNEEDYDTEALRDFLINLKKSNLQEKTIIFEPRIDLTYEALIKIMDSVRMFRKTDESIYYKDQDGNDVKVESLFEQIIFGNLLS